MVELEHKSGSVCRAPAICTSSHISPHEHWVTILESGFRFYIVKVGKEPLHPKPQCRPRISHLPQGGLVLKGKVGGANGEVCFEVTLKTLHWMVEEDTVCLLS